MKQNNIMKWLSLAITKRFIGLRQNKKVIIKLNDFVPTAKPNETIVDSRKQPDLLFECE